MAKYKREDIDLAYRKLKSYVYYDNFSLLLRQRIAEFESDSNFETRLNQLLKYVNNAGREKGYFDSLLNEISFYAAPKSYDREESKYKENIVSNNFSQESYRLKKLNYFFDGPIELHIITVLWILNEGYVLHGDYAKDNYAYFLELNSDNGSVVDGLRLFKPYFDQYQRWRDNGVDTAKRIVEEDTDVVILSLDIKEYYYNITYDPNLQAKLHSIISKRLGGKVLLFTQLIFEINEKYQSVCPRKGGSTMPIGLLSSGILANWYLNEFDKQVKEELSPAYYGRYVDDILIVLSNTKITKKETSKSVASPLESFLKKFFVDRNIFDVREPTAENGQIQKSYRYRKDGKIEIQKDKITVYSFESKESQAVLDMFKKKIEHNSSAFWFLPSERDINDDFDESVYELTYSDTINKLRSVTDIKQSKYGASVFLAKRIKVSLLSGKRKDDKTTEQILTFFKGIINLEFANLWEKVLTYFVIVDDRDSFWKFFKETVNSIEKIQAFDNKRIRKAEINRVKKYLGNYLMNCCSLATSLNPNFVDQNWWEKRCGNFKFNWLSKSFNKKVYALKNDYIFSNLLRNSFVVVPLLNYLNLADNRKTNLVKYDALRDIDDELSPENLEFDQRKFKYAPRFIYLHEFNLAYYLKGLLNNKQNDSDNFSNELSHSIYEKSFTTFFDVNYKFRNGHYELNKADSKPDFKENLKNYYFQHDKTYRSKVGQLGYDVLKIPQSKKIQDELRIAVVNTRVLPSNIDKSLFAKPNTGIVRRKEFIDILNDAEKVKSDILVLPEVSTPYRWLPLIADQARRKQRAIIVGLEHIRIHDTCYNLLATCLPLEHNGIKDVVVNLRLKNHYSPKESETILNRGKKVPVSLPSLYNLFVWGGIHFSNYNCYELADINHRALFKSKVDLLFASEYNQDINYFSNIVESVSRDVHCYFVQVNSSDFGDSRITAPVKTVSKDILRLKGGENSVVLLGKIDIKKLRDFQKTRVQGQDTTIFKNTPPNFDHLEVEKR